MKQTRGGIVITNYKNEYLVVLGRKALKWSLPKGHIVDGESYRDCAKRETFEETGLIVDIPETAETYITRDVVYFYLNMSNIIGDTMIVPQDKKEVIRGAWISGDDLKKMARHEVNSDLWRFIKRLN